MPILGQHPGESYTDDEGRLYYDTLDGQTYRTDKGRRGLYVWSQRGTSAEWRQLRGETQFGPMNKAQFAAAIGGMVGDPPYAAPGEQGEDEWADILDEPPEPPTPDEIRDWRSRLGWTQEEASSALGLARRHLSDLETGNRNAKGYLRLAMERLEGMHG